STSKPIEGVASRMPPLWALRPAARAKRRRETPNCTHVAKIFGDPNEPDNGPFMEGAYLAHAVYGFFQNGGGLCWVVRVGAADGAEGRPGAALPAPARAPCAAP